ncbi:MAG: nicotinate-nucleotide--dimethylbenzimidazole phosphoribosyltransferase, partial [Actinomycetota bacterium]|nr:nicotinate-nucleotide--dimethylbenzimidazole phosphoribosyltransferase [Actinomycetota bacterium]
MSTTSGPASLDEAVTEPDVAAADAARRHQASLAKPPGSLGRVEDLAVWAAAVQGRCPPEPFGRARVVVFAGDHGIAAAGVSTRPAEVTGQMVHNILAGGATVNALARAAGASVRVVDLAVDADTPEEVCQYKVRRGSGRIDRVDALSPEETRQAFDAGTRIADQEIDEGADLLIAGDLGVGNTTPASTIVAALCGVEPIAVIGRGSGIDDDTWMRKLSAIRDALRRVRGRVSPLTLLQVAGGADLAAMTGFLAQAAVRRTPALLDGLVPTAAALVAQQVTPAAPQWWLASHR